ncbi:MAG: DUF1926 domain-containing protein [Nitrospirae bacterium]|nr:DUF1926 domain-containing protein [Nitrospirota bacterium]
MSKLHLILAFHNHQPVGNFDHVLEDCYAKSYLPFLETLLGHPKLKVVLHYSGHLLSWMRDHHPEAIEILRNLVREQRVELLSGGFYEPILTVLPEKDRPLQVKELSRFIAKNIGLRPRGMWLAERVWEPQMPKFIAEAGIEYLPIDDYHFKLTGLEDKDLLGYYITEEDGNIVSVFPGSEKLRYLIPFRSVEETIAYFREISMRQGNPLLTMADDGEKFGVWPNTYKHCYEDRWLDRFFTALEDNSDWLETTTFSSYYERFQPLGKVYLPTASYREMGEWTLPPEGAIEYEQVLELLEKSAGDRAKQLLRGGIWRAFFTKYPESNHIHKRMRMISQRVHEASSTNPKKGKAALAELWKGQCNDAYWHGIFGGLYLPHLRSALYRHLLRAETLACDILKDYKQNEKGDFDCDGFEDVLIGTKSTVLAATERGGSLTELSLRKQSVNILDILTRRPEAYHAKVAQASEAVAGGTKTIHDQLTVKEEGLSEYLVYDKQRRVSLLDHFLPAETTLDAMAGSSHEELGDFTTGIYSLTRSYKKGDISLVMGREGVVAGNRVDVRKKIDLTHESRVELEYLLKGTFGGLFAVEMNLSLLGSPFALIRVGDKTLQARSKAVHERIRGFVVEDTFLKLRLQFSFSEDIQLWHYPVETISLSEQGVERLYQGTALLFVLPIPCLDRKIVTCRIDHGEEPA